ncbi:FK506-binding protein [Methanoculleus chikugoensis]|jgi:FKBP-type peptidyl-prolyl cis-trans isomerase 2|uniref:Peptidyl-prolyl cis-trans isomerase n=1 Tax=Methanoculleus chikugoensis TaxID=118126 RepID=A0A1M4MPJ4_9EURY|nr:peptidylprolyl isomerase [Methanoculleus chikugoensis]MDD4567673.1 peptidylprolyl isomerase [Methanoculleus chikugoensis]NMA10483.1 peptidylprolyl isomerase [Methanomicrobiales archaeon]SCL76762.1 FK506-binding protein [Methanoculleus chikugoensis]
MKGRLACGALLLIACTLILCSGCIAGDREAERVKPGDTVLVHYTGTLDNGTVFDSSAEREPLRFTIGTGRVIPGFDEGVVGMQVGEEKTLQIPADRAYGPYREDLIFAIDPAGIAGVENLTVGDQVGLPLQNGQMLPAKVVAVSADAVTVDANHHLAGEDLTFNVRLVEIV